MKNIPELDPEIVEEEKFNIHQRKKAAPHCPHCGKKMSYERFRGHLMEWPYYLEYTHCGLTLRRQYFVWEEGWTDAPLHKQRPKYTLVDHTIDTKKYKLDEPYEW